MPINPITSYAPTAQGTGFVRAAGTNLVSALSLRHESKVYLCDELDYEGTWINTLASEAVGTADRLKAGRGIC